MDSNMLIGAQKRHRRSQTRKALYDLVVIGPTRVLRCHKDDITTLDIPHWNVVAVSK